MRSSVYIGYGLQRGSSTSSPLWRSKCCKDVHQATSGGPLVRVVDVSGRRALRSADTSRILVPPVTSTTVGSRAFSVAAPRIWNSLPDDVISTESLPTFQRQLKRHLFCQSFPLFFTDILHPQWTLQWLHHLGHSKNTLID